MISHHNLIIRVQYKICMQINLIVNKKVLQRERKRHTARRVASARSAALSPDGKGGYPHPVPMGRRVPPSSRDDGGGGVSPSSPDDGGYPHPVLTEGTHRKDGGTPLSRRIRVPPFPHRQDYMGVTPLSADGGTPSGCELTHKLKILPSLSFGCGW